MDINPSSSRFRQPTNSQGFYNERPGSYRQTGPKIQRINHVPTEPEDEVLNLEEEIDSIHFLEENPSYLAGRQLKILIDTGTSKNYIKPIKELKGIMSIGKPFIVHSIHGNNQITQKCVVNLYGRNTLSYILNNLVGRWPHTPMSVGSNPSAAVDCLR